MLSLSRGRHRLRETRSDGDIIAAQALRHWCFHGTPGLDADPLDARCRHVLVEDARDGALVACCRVMTFADGAEIARSYSAQFYDLAALAHFPAPLVELGRFCIHPDHPDPDILRLAWAGLTRIVDDGKVGLLFGCSSFKGTEPAPYLDAFAALGASHLAPARWQPGVKAPEVFPFARALANHIPDPRRAARAMPPLLRSYLAMGGWVSDHAVVDAAMNTLHVFTGLEIAAIPPARARSLRQTAA